MEENRGGRISLALLKGFAVLVGPFGAPIEGLLQYLNDGQLDRLERAIREAQKDQERRFEETFAAIRGVLGEQAAAVQGLVDLATTLLSVWVRTPDAGRVLDPRQTPPSEQEIERLAEKSIAVKPDLKSILSLLRRGLKDNYSDMPRLWSHISGTGFPAAEFPMHAETVALGSESFRKDFRHQSPLVQDAVLVALVNQNAMEPAFRNALVSHRVMLAMDESGDGPSEPPSADGGTSSSGGDTPIPDWQKRRVQTLTGWKPDHQAFEHCKNPGNSARDGTTCDVIVHSLALTAHLQRLNRAAFETWNVAERLAALVDALRDLGRPISSGSEDDAVRAAVEVGSVMQELLDAVSDLRARRAYRHMDTVGPFDRLQKFLNYRARGLNARTKRLVPYLECLWNGVGPEKGSPKPDRGQTSLIKWVSLPGQRGTIPLLRAHLCEDIEEYIRTLKEVLRRRLEDVEPTVAGLMRCKPDRLCSTIADAMFKLPHNSISDVAPWPPGYRP